MSSVERNSKNVYSIWGIMMIIFQYEDGIAELELDEDGKW